MTNTTTSEPIQCDQFHLDAASVLSSFRNSVLGIVRSITAPPINTHDIEKALGIDKTLAWKITNIACSTSPFDVARHIPGRSAIKIIVRAGNRIGIAPETLNGILDAFSEYENLIHRHAGDRASLEMMLLGYAQKDRSKANQEYRKSAFRANSFIFGIQSQITFRSYILQPSIDHDGLFDLVSLRGHIGIRRIRNDAPWTVHRSRVTDDSGSPITFQKVKPLDPTIQIDANSAPVPWMTKYCSHPLPDVERITQKGNHIHCDILKGNVGNQSMTTCVLGEFVTGAAQAKESPGNKTVELAMKADMPTETLVLDQLIHQDLVNFSQPMLGVFSELTGPTPSNIEAASRHRIPMEESPQYLGTGIASANSMIFPQYKDLLKDAFEYCEWSSNKFIVHRTIIKYPPTPSAVVHSIPLVHSPM